MVAKSASSRASDRNGRLSRWVVLAIVICTVIVLLLVGLARRPTHLSPAPEDATAVMEFVPQNAMLTATWLTDPDNLFSHLSAAASLQATFHQRTGLNYDRDVRPWLGPGVALSILPRMSQPRMAQHGAPDYLLALSVTSGDSAREFLELLWQRQALLGKPITLKTVDGAEALIPGSDSALWPMALVGNRYLLIASTVSALYRSLRAAQAPSLNLPHQDRYRNGLSVLPNAKLGLFHINVPAALSVAGLAQPRVSAPMLELLLSVTTTQQNLSLHTAVLPEVRPDHAKPVALARSLPKPSASNPLVSAQAVPLPQDRLMPVALLPERVTALAVGDNLAQAWQRLTHELQFYRHLSDRWVQVQTGWSSALGTAVNPILKTCLTGHSVIARTDAVEGILLAEHTPKTATAIATLDQLARQSDLTVTPLTVQQRPVTAWTRLRTQTQENRKRQGGSAQRETIVQTDVVAVHTVYEGYDLWATSIAALSDTLDATGTKLVSQPRFQQRVKPQRKDEYLYVDAQALVPQLLGQLPILDLLGIAAYPVLETLETALVSPIVCVAELELLCQQADIDLWFTPSE